MLRDHWTAFSVQGFQLFRSEVGMVAMATNTRIVAQAR